MSDEKLIPLTYRNWLHGIPPRRIKLEVPGWSGENSWKAPQPWHCKPFADANSYGLELIYTWKTTCIVTCDEKGMCKFEGDFESEKPSYLGKTWQPFACFAPFHFGFVAMVDIKTPDGYNLMVMPHPRFYSDRDGSTPCAIPGQLEMDWWPEIFFIVFKAPLGNNKLIFKHGDPIAQFMIVPRNIKYDINQMSDTEASLRAKRQGNLEENWNRLCTRVFYCKENVGDGNEFFDNKYKVLSQIAKRDGNEAVGKILDNPKLIPHWKENPQVIDSRKPENQIVEHDPWTQEQLMNDIEKRQKQYKQNKLEDKAKKLEEEISLTNEDLEKMYEPDLLNKIDAALAKDEITDTELDQLITDFKMHKRKERIQNSNNLRSQSDPKKIIELPKKQSNVTADSKDEYVLGYKIEKLL